MFPDAHDQRSPQTCLRTGRRGRNAAPPRLVLVKPKTDPDNLFQWIYNDADIDASRCYSA